MTLAPLPIPTRIYRGENIDSYSRRHAGRNHCAPSDVDRALREHGILTTKARQHPERLHAWRTLSSLRDTAFTEPDRILDEEVTERALCRRCTRGEPARGRLPELGMVHPAPAMARITPSRPARLLPRSGRRTPIPASPRGPQRPARFATDADRP